MRNAFSNLYQYSIFLKEGALNQVTITTAIVMQPPNITEGTVPRSFAATPLSNWPSSLDELMNILFTAITLPRSSSGVFN